MVDRQHPFRAALSQHFQPRFRCRMAEMRFSRKFLRGILRVVYQQISPPAEVSQAVTLPVRMHKVCGVYEGASAGGHFQRQRSAGMTRLQPFQRERPDLCRKFKLMVYHPCRIHFRVRRPQRRGYQAPDLFPDIQPVPGPSVQVNLPVPVEQC